MNTAYKTFYVVKRIGGTQFRLKIFWNGRFTMNSKENFSRSIHSSKSWEEVNQVNLSEILEKVSTPRIYTKYGNPDGPIGKQRY